MQGGVAALLYNGSAAGIFLAVRHGAPTLAGKCVGCPMGCGFVLAVQDITIVCPEESLLLCSSVCQLCRKKIPCWGMTRRLRRGWWGCRPEGGSTFFRSERKYQRQHAARRLQRRPAPLRVAGFGLREPFGLSSTSVRYAHPPGKRLLLPILTAGLAMSRAMELDSYHLRLERARARLFPLSKWASLFPSAAYRRSAPPQVAWGKLKWRCLGCSSVAGRLRSAEKQDYFFLCCWH